MEHERVRHQQGCRRIRSARSLPLTVRKRWRRLHRNERRQQTQKKRLSIHICYMIGVNKTQNLQVQQRNHRAQQKDHLHCHLQRQNRIVWDFQVLPRICSVEGETFVKVARVLCSSSSDQKVWQQPLRAGPDQDEVLEQLFEMSLQDALTLLWRWMLNIFQAWRWAWCH